MNNDYLKNIIKELTSFDIISLTQIPDIDLYMDQVTTFMEDKLKNRKRNESDKIFTKTMINNYTKAGLINPPVKKKYSKKHIILLILIYHLKSELSINDISRLLADISEDSSEFIYSEFINLQETENKHLSEEVLSNLNSLLSKCKYDRHEYLLIILMLINQANMRRQIAEKLIDVYFAQENEK